MCVKAGQTWNLRRDPDETAYILEVLTGGDEVEIIAGVNTWRKVKVLTGRGAGRVGFVNSSGLENCK